MKTTKRFFIGYATRQGQTAAIASHVALRLRARGHFVLLQDIASAPSWLDPLHGCDAVFLAASIHKRRHEPEMVEFVRQNLEIIAAWPSAFISVSLTQMMAERQSATADERAIAHRDVQAMTDQFIHDTGRHPGIVRAAAAAVAHSRYSIAEHWAVTRLLGERERISDPSRDHVYTSWPSMDALADDLEARTSCCAAARRVRAFCPTCFRARIPGAIAPF